MIDEALASVLVFSAVMVPVGVALYIAAGSPVAMPAALAIVASLVAWLASLHRRHGSNVKAADRTTGAFQLYIGTVVVLILQHTEEWLRHFPNALTSLFPAAYPAGVTFDDRMLISAFPLAGSVLFLLGALAYYQRRVIGEGAAWLLFTWAIVSGGAHFLYTVAAGTGVRYIGGMAMAPFAIALGILGIRELSRANSDAFRVAHPESQVTGI